MSYAAKGENVFLYQDPAHPNCTPPLPRRSDHRLKRFQSTVDKRAWHLCEEVRGTHFHDLMSGSQTCLDAEECHKYVPLEDLIRILMAQKDELIRELQEQLRQCCREQRDSADKELLQNQIEGLTEEVNKSRDMLRKAMHKLENIDEIVNENKKLQCRLRCSEERVKYLEEKEKHLESELRDLRSKSQIQIDLEKAQQMLSMVTKQREETTEMDEAYLQCLALERDELQEKVKKLEKELGESKKKEAEIEMLKKQSQSDSLDKEEMSRENECYKKKLASMKCLEKQIQELKKQGRALVDKYKREAQKAAEQMNKMGQAAKELQCLREERDSLRKRVNELASYECQYNKLQRKLQRVDAVIAENESLNCKLSALQKLEKENEYLKCRLEGIEEMEMNAVEDKERIMQLQCAVADQEEEMKDLLCQIERLTSGRHEEELERLKCELFEKNSKLKLCEEQLAEIPMLEAEIDELRMKLQCCCREFPEKKRGENSYQKVEVRFPATSTGIRVKYKTPGEKCSSIIGIRREERVELKDKHSSCQEILQADSGGAYKVTSEFSQKKDVMSCEEVQYLLQSSKGIISCVLEDMMEHQKEMEELEVRNRSMKEEIETLKSKVGRSNTDNLLEDISCLERALDEKELEISRLRSANVNDRDSEDMETIKELNRQLKAELEAACVRLKQVANLEKMLEEEHKARCEAESRLRDEGQSRPAEVGKIVEDSEIDCCKVLRKETDGLKLQIEALNKLTDELKKENELLRELQQPCPDFSKELDEKCALENLLSLLQAELDAFKGQKLSDECEALRNELKRVMEQNCQLKALLDCYRQRLDLEKKSNELNQMKLDGEGGKQTESHSPTSMDRSVPAGGSAPPDRKTPADGRTPAGASVDADRKTPQGESVAADRKTPAGGSVTADGSTPPDEETARGSVAADKRTAGGSIAADRKTTTGESTPYGKTARGSVAAGWRTPEGEPVFVDLRTPEGESVVADRKTPEGRATVADRKTPEGGSFAADTKTPEGRAMAADRKPPEGGSFAADTKTPEGRAMAADRKTSEDGSVVGDRKTPEGGSFSADTKTPEVRAMAADRKTSEDGSVFGDRKTPEGGSFSADTKTPEVRAMAADRKTPEGGSVAADKSPAADQSTPTGKFEVKEKPGALPGEKATGETEKTADGAKQPGVSPGLLRGAMSSPSQTARERKPAETVRPPGSDKPGQDVFSDKAKGAVTGEKTGCEEELKALRDNLLQLQGENELLKNSLKEAEKRPNLAGKPGDAEKELEELKKEKNAVSQALDAGTKGKAGTTDEGAAADAVAECLKELERLRKEKADFLKELEQLRKEKNDVAKQLDAATVGKGVSADPVTAVKAGPTDAGQAAAADKEKADLLKELEQLRKERDDLAKQLAEGGGGKRGAADAGPAAAVAAADKEKADCLKELEQLRKERDDLAKQLAEGGGGKTGTADAGPAAGSEAAAVSAADKEKADLLKELEQLRKEKDDLAKRLAEATAGGAPSGSPPDKETADLLKQLEELRREKNEMAQRLTEAKARGSAVGPGGPGDLQERIRQVEAENADKLKKLMEQHEKEMLNREKTYNENLNAMKSGYETDIRKLTERHKQSVMRLQELHEDEVQEMNLNYETQMEALQTQSEAAINDVAKGSAAKTRKLTEQHSKDIKDMERKFHVALGEKESQYLEELGGLRSDLDKSMQEVETLKKKTKQGAEGDVDRLKAQQAREIQKTRRVSKQKLDAMKDKMKEERRKSEAEIESLKHQLKEQGRREGVCECKFSRKKPPKPRDPNCPLDFNEVLEKILEEGLDALTFNEIALVHGKTCCALEGIVMRSDASPVLELEPPIGNECPHAPLLEADKQQLLSRIFDLENAILQKQRQTQDAIINMEVAIKKERCRLQEVRDLLQSEQQKNSELNLLLDGQAKLHTDLKKERDKLGNQVSVHRSLCLEKSKQLDEEMRSRKCLEAEVEKLRNTLKQLRTSLDAGRGNPDTTQADQVESMRVKLEQSIHQERWLALQLENEAKCRMQLQCQLQTLRQSLRHMVNLPAVESVDRCSQNPLEAKSAKERENLDQINEKRNKMKVKSIKKQKK